MLAKPTYLIARLGAIDVFPMLTLGYFIFLHLPSTYVVNFSPSCDISRVFRGIFTARLALSDLAWQRWLLRVNLLQVNQPLLQTLFDEEERRPLTVSELTEQVRTEVERRFADVWVEGEIVNFAAAGSGHWYFTLHDETTQIKAACFKSSNYRIRFMPSDGLQVRVRGKLTVYPPRGEYQLIVESLEPVGEGALAVVFEQIRARLDREGLFAEELKRPLPFFPRRIGVVTSPTGAAFFDILHVLSRRARSVSVVLIPARVQGETAGNEIRLAIRRANDFNLSVAVDQRLDVLIVGRGGGSAEDLWAFNEEGVARAIRDSLIPVISAVGHEIDFTIADFVADMRAATPSAAAEIVAAKEADIEEFIDSRELLFERLAERKLLKLRSNLQTLAMSPVFTEFPNQIGSWKYEIDDHVSQMKSAVLEKIKQTGADFERIAVRLSPVKLAHKLGQNKTSLAVLVHRQSTAARKSAEAKARDLGNLSVKLDSLSPLSVLHRGYSITQLESGMILRNASDTAKGDKLKIRLANGKLDAEVLSSES
jgi:exodeoxyribonuclease VII large subunit